MTDNDSALVRLAQFSTKQRKDLGAKGKALKKPGGEAPSFPIRNVEDLKNAIQAFGRAKPEDKERLKRFIMKRARELGAENLIPDSWKGGGNVAASAIERLELLELTQEDLDLIELGSRASLDRSPKKNWVENSGELPGYIREIARSIEKKRGVPLSRAIALAIGAIKRWARGGGGVDADTRAKAAAALAKWEALKAKNRARKKD